jgi:hypothetical protein
MPPTTYRLGLTVADSERVITIVEDWQPGRLISTAGRKKIVLASGIMSRTGAALRQLDGFIRYLEKNLGYTSGDFLEISYHSEIGPWGRRPEPYEPRHCEVSLEEGVAQVVHSLRWYRGRLPDDTEYHLIGYSLGGVTLFDAATRLADTEPERWRGRLATLTTLSAPLFGADLGLEGDLLGLLGFGALLPGGVAVREVISHGQNREHRARVERDARRLAAFGVKLLTLADAEDVVVTPDDAVIAPPDQRDAHVLSGPRVPLGAPDNNPFGHGPLLRNTLAWVRMARLIGPQTSRR